MLRDATAAALATPDELLGLKADAEDAKRAAAIAVDQRSFMIMRRLLLRELE